ncbi:4-hydroxy-tetrahydrodipicolinate synthase [Rhodothermaceae bacterium RA]|nr:4-hydroxy-tetrahydrodipicolinate synthase [Rhodothermaceae bacterium RA]
MSRTPLFTGTAPALVTPFTADGTLDEAAFRRLIDYQIEGGVEALVVLGTTGENPTITFDERVRLVETAVAHTAGRVPVIVGTGSNATAESVTFARQATAAGADGQLVVGPYYNKPSQEGFRAHVAAIADATDLPIILYNVPGRTSFNLQADTVLRLAEEVPSVVGIKEASGNLAQISDILRHRPAHLAVYAGDDEWTLPLVLLGGDGVISVISNALPHRFSTLVRTALAGDVAEARRLHMDLLPAMRACFFDTNPIPIKAVLAEMGLIEPTLRLPLVPMPDTTRRRVLEAFETLISVTA